MSSDCSFKGVPMKKIYRGTDQWHLNHLPPIQNKRDHIVLFQLPIDKDSTTPPKPHKGETKWDASHVRLPCAPQNDYKAESSSDPTKEVKTSRWEIIQIALLKEIHSSRELEQAIKTYNSKYAKEWNFKCLHALFEQELDDAESVSFFRKTLPDIVRLALRLPEIIPCAIPLLRRGHNKSISLSQEQIACLLANAFLCTFPRRNERSRHSEYASYPRINFSALFASSGDQNIEKIKCICNYFRRLGSKIPAGVVTFTRRSVSDGQLPQWDQCEKTFADSMLHVTDDGNIEDDGEGLLQVDFANKYLGGGVLNYGCVQEEIRFMICPELLCSLLFTEMLDDNECLLIMGCERYSYYSGYASSFEWTGDYVDSTPYDSSKRRKCTIVAIDAVPFHSKRVAQYQDEMILRELNKAYIGFKHNLDTPAPGVATGNWGCGAFLGDKHLKSLIQLMACCFNERPLVYYTFGDEQLRDDLFMIFEYLQKNKVKIGELWSCLLAYADNRKKYNHLYEFVMAYHQDLSDRKSNNNGHCSKQANRSADKTTLKPKSITKATSKPKTEFKRTESDDILNTVMNDIEVKQYEIKDSDDDDDQYTMDETMELLQKSEPDWKKVRPKLSSDGLATSEISSPNVSRSIGNRTISSPSDNRPGKTIQHFFAKSPSNTAVKSENQDKRPRSMLVDRLDDDYVRKSPAKIKRNAVTPKKTVISMLNTTADLKPLSPEAKGNAILVENYNEVDEQKSNDNNLCETKNADESNAVNDSINSVISEDLFETETESDSKMEVSDHDVEETKVSNREKSQNKTPMKAADRQRASFEGYFKINKRQNTSTHGNAQKKTADDLNESSSSNHDKSPSDRTMFNEFRDEEGTTYESQEDQSEMSINEHTEVEGATLLTDDESDTEINVEIDHLKSLNVTSDQTSIQIE